MWYHISRTSTGAEENYVVSIGLILSSRRLIVSIGTRTTETVVDCVVSVGAVLVYWWIDSYQSYQ